ncbi:hypothetical protein [Methylophaga sp.]|uniref:hypothetical protein n=1 Tax=Methylophaga sp. TaxID=2024840 RepID=UPI003A8D862A
MNRIKASLVHLSVSIIFFIFFSSLLVYLWYPEFYFYTAGGWQGLKIAAFVDLVLGPLLTLIVFDRNKVSWKIRFDLTVIGILQISALSWAIFAIYGERPVASVFWDGQIYVVSALDYENNASETDFLEQFGSPLPVLIYAEKPDKPSELAALYNKITKEQIPPYELIELYRPFEKNFSIIQAYSIDIERFMSSNVLSEKKLREKIEALNTDMDELVYIPLKSKYKDILMLFDNQGKLVDYILISDIHRH